MHKKCILSSNQVVFILSCYMILVFNLGFWHYVLQHVIFRNNVVLWLTLPVVMLAAMNFCMQLLFWPYLHRVFVPLIFILGSAASYAVMTQNIYFDANMLQNIIQTNPGEAMAWLTPRFWVWLGLTGLLPAQ